jgi:hypothetical protein
MVAVLSLRDSPRIIRHASDCLIGLTSDQGWRAHYSSDLADSVIRLIQTINRPENVVSSLSVLRNFTTGKV